MNTLHVDLGRTWRGGQKQVWLLLRGLRTRGHGAELLAPRDSPLARRCLAEGFPVHAVGTHAARLQAAYRLRRRLAQERFEIVHAHDAHSLTAAWLARVHCRTSVVASRRLAYPLQPGPVALSRYRVARRVLAVSRFVEESTIRSGLSPDQVEVVYDGVELPPFPAPRARLEARARWGAAPDQPILGCVGYLLPEKGQEILLRALPAVLAEFPSCRLLLAGDGPSRPQLERLARELGVEPAVQFTGFVDAVEQVYAALDVFLFPSRAEPLGSSLLDAMARGLPIVATEGGAVSEVVEDNRNGLLVSERNPAAVATAILRPLRDPALAARLGAAARETIRQRFTADHMVERTLGVYQALTPAEACP